METRNVAEIEERPMEALTVAGVRTRGKISECGPVFKLLCRKMARRVSGKPMTLYYGLDLDPNDADFEPSLPVRPGKEVGGIAVHTLAEGRCVRVVHEGPYETLCESYQRAMDYIREHGYRAGLPIREIYLKGPGMIWRGNPQKYRTEIQVPIETT